MRILEGRATPQPPTVAPLSYGQRALWFLYQLAPRSAAYNIYYALRIRAPLDVAALRRTLQALLDRHPALRTTYRMRQGQPVQSTRATQRVCFTVTDATAWSEDALQARLAEDAYRPFDLARGPVYRTHLFTRAGQEAVLLLTLHHIAADGWSLGILLQELFACYTQAANGRPLALPELHTDYAVYMAHQQELLEGPAGQQLWDYWNKQLRDVPPLELPTDGPRPPIQTDHGAAYTCRLSTTLTRQVKACARQFGTTPYVVLLTAYQVLLHRYARQTDFLIGAAVADREGAAVAGGGGCFF